MLFTDILLLGVKIFGENFLEDCQYGLKTTDFTLLTLRHCLKKKKKDKSQNLVGKCLCSSIKTPGVEASLHLEVKRPWLSDLTSLSSLFLSVKWTNNSTFLLCLKFRRFNKKKCVQKTTRQRVASLLAIFIAKTLLFSDIYQPQKFVNKYNVQYQGKYKVTQSRSMSWLQSNMVEGNRKYHCI